MESVRTYESVLRKIDERANIVPLVAQLKKDLQATFMEGMVPEINISQILVQKSSRKLFVP